nr:keratin, type I cytoskeletal 9-like [Setaria viridis]
MDGHSDDPFSQPDPPFPSGAFDLFSQADSYQGPRSGMQTLDLNSQVDEFPAFTSYADILRGDDGGVARGGGAHTLRLRVPRNGGGGSRGGGGTRGGGAGGSKGRSKGGGAIRGGGSGCSRGGGHATRNLFIGSASDGGAGGGGRGGGRAGGRRRRGASVDEEGFLYADEGNAPDVADGVEVIFPSSSKDANSSTKFSSDDEDNHTMEDLSSEDETMEFIMHCRKRNREFANMMLMVGMYYESYIHKAPRRVATMTSIEWVNETLSNTTSCYNMFRMSCPLFH